MVNSTRYLHSIKPEKKGEKFFKKGMNCYFNHTPSFQHAKLILKMYLMRKRVVKKLAEIEVNYLEVQNNQTKNYCGN